MWSQHETTIFPYANCLMFSLYSISHCVCIMHNAGCKGASKMNVGFKRLDPDLPMLTKGYANDACHDLYIRQDVVLPPRGGHHVDFGLALELPRGYEGLIRSRSGWTNKGILVIHGTIDCNYRGEIGAYVFNSTHLPRLLPRGIKIAQLAIRQIPEIEFREVETLTPSERGDRGFGSTGM